MAGAGALAGEIAGSRSIGETVDAHWMEVLRMNPLRDPSEAQLLERLLAGVLASRPAIVRSEVLKDSGDYFIGSFTLERAERPLVVKLAGPNARLACPFDRTMALSRMIRSRTAVPTIEVLAADVSCREFPWRYLIYWGAPGRSWMDVAPRLSRSQMAVLYADLGQTVARLHGLEFPAFGELTVDGGVDGTNDYVRALSERGEGSPARITPTCSAPCCANTASCSET